MEFDFGLLVLAALVGMVIKLVIGWDPWKLLGSLADRWRDTVHRRW